MSFLYYKKPTKGRSSVLLKEIVSEYDYFMTCLSCLGPSLSTNADAWQLYHITTFTSQIQSEHDSLDCSIKISTAFHHHNNKSIYKQWSQKIRLM